MTSFEPSGVCDFPEVVILMFRKFFKNYPPRHRNRTNQALHLLGVPLTFIGTPWAMAVSDTWHWPVVCFLAGYALQFAGHAAEGNDAGEVVFFKKMLGMPYTEYGRREQSSSHSDKHDDRTDG